MLMIKGSDTLAEMGQSVAGIGRGQDFGQSLNRAFRRIDNSILDHLKMEDLSGAFKEIAGVEIVDANGNVRNHIREVENALTGLNSGIKTLQHALRNADLTDETRAFVEAKLSGASRLKESIERFLEKAEKLE